MKNILKNGFTKKYITITGLIFLLAFLILIVIRQTSGTSLGIRAFAKDILDHTKAVIESSSVTQINKGEYTNIIFLHHSVGYNLIERGDIRNKLSQAGFSLWDHGYNWEGLRDPQGKYQGYSFTVPDDNTDPDGLSNIFSQPLYGLPLNTISGLMQFEVIIFKSCYTGNIISSVEQLEKVKNYYLSIRDFIDQHPDKLFILLTSPPLNPSEVSREMKERDWVLNQWLMSPDFLKDRKNFYVFNFFQLLVEQDTAAADWGALRAAYRDGSDSHPNLIADQTIAPILVDFITMSVNQYKTTLPPTR